MAMKPGTVSPTDTNHKLRGHQIRTRAQHSTTNRSVHVTLPLSLAKCPFCGSPAEIRNGPFTYAQCTVCEASGPRADKAGVQDPATAARRWNTRMVLKRRTHGT